MPRPLQTYFRAGTAQKVSFNNSAGASVASTNAFGTQLTAIAIWGDEPFYFDIAASPTAAATTPAMPANTVTVWQVSDGNKIAALGVSASGTLYITELDNGS